MILAPIGMYYRIRSQATKEKLDRRQEGWFILLTLRPIAALVAITLFAYLLKPSMLPWARIVLPEWLRWIGVPFFAAAGVLVIWTFKSLGKNLTDTVVLRKEHTLVTAGPYRWVRHPLYTAVVLMVVGTSLIAANWLLFAAGTAVFLLLVLRTRTEEGNLIARFGNDYREYMKRTGRFLPQF